MSDQNLIKGRLYRHRYKKERIQCRDHLHPRRIESTLETVPYLLDIVIHLDKCRLSLLFLFSRLI